MKQFSKFITASVLLAFSGLAHANLITVTDKYEVKQTVTTTSSVTFQHDFTNDGYIPMFDIIESATLEFTLQDNGNGKNQGGPETFTLKINHDGSTLYSGANIPNGTTTFSDLKILGDPLASLSATGKLWFTLAAKTGDFEFMSSTLAAQYKAGVKEVDVPEPFSVALVGIGLAAIGAARRKA